MQLAAATAGGQPHLAGQLYVYLVGQAQYPTPEARQALIRRLRETLMKLVVIIGVPKCLEAIFAIDGVERPEDKDYSCSRWVRMLTAIGLADRDLHCDIQGVLAT